MRRADKPVPSAKRGALHQTSLPHASPHPPTQSRNDISIARSPVFFSPQRNPEIQVSERHFWILDPNMLVVKKPVWGLPWLFSG